MTFHSSIIVPRKKFNTSYGQQIALIPFITRTMDMTEMLDENKCDEVH